MSTPAEALPPAAIDRPQSGWRRVLGDWLVVGSATAVCHVLGAATSLLLRWLLSPTQMGIWQALKLFLSYGNYANLGISKGAVREFNVALGGGQTARARRGLNLAFTVNTLTSVLYAAVLVGVGAWIALTGSSVWATQWAVGLVAVGAVAVLARYVTFHVTILRASQDFTTTSQLSILEAVLTLSVCGLATWCWGLPGLYGGTLVVLLASLVFLRAVSSLFRSLDKLMILGYLSDREFQLGCYSLALMVTAQLFGLGNVLSMVTGPRYGETYGRTGDRRRVARLAARAGELQAAAMVLPAALALIVAPPVLARLLPDYETGLAPLRYLVPGAVALVLALPGSQYLIAVGRQRLLIATAVAALGNHVALSGGYGLPGVAAATAAGYVVYFLIVSAVSLWVDLDGPARTRYAAMLALAVGPTLGLALWLQPSSPPAETGWPTVALQTAAVLAVWGLAIAYGWFHGGWGREFRGVRQS